jgi:hypothetical protein
MKSYLNLVFQIFQAQLLIYWLPYALISQFNFKLVIKDVDVATF